jgi:hypothetical protein
MAVVGRVATQRTAPATPALPAWATAPGPPLGPATATRGMAPASPIAPMGPEALRTGAPADGRPPDAPASLAPRWRRSLPWVGPAILVFLVSLLLDLRTIMPGLGYWDTGEFQALGPVLGIAHPTGYPSYTLLLWLASVVLQPVGEAAFRANLLSALLVSGAAAFAAIAAVQLTRRWWLGIVSGLALAVSEIAWRNALRADPHAFQVFLVGLLLVLLIAWAERERADDPRAGRWLVAASAAFALAVTNHGLTVALAPGVAVYVFLVQPRILWRRPKTVVACVATLAVLTVAIYAYLPIRSSMDPPLDYAHPANWVNTNADGEVTGGFRYLVLGEQFQGQFLRIPDDPLQAIPENLADGANVAMETVGHNLGSLLALLAVLGVPLGLWRRPRETIMTGLWFALTFTFALGYPNADITRYYLAPLLVACVWAALAIDGLWALVRWALPSLARGPDPARPEGGIRRLAGALVAGVAAILLLSPTLGLIPDRYDELDASGDTGARRWLDATLAALPEDAVVVSWWSYSTPLWYGRYVEGRRPDITIIDDRDVVDDDLGDVPTVVADWMAQGTRPVFVVRLDRDLAEIEADWQLEPLDGVPRGEPVYRVVGPAGGG